MKEDCVQGVALLDYVNGIQFQWIEHVCGKALLFDHKIVSLLLCACTQLMIRIVENSALDILSYRQLSN